MRWGLLLELQCFLVGDLFLRRMSTGEWLGSRFHRSLWLYVALLRPRDPDHERDLLDLRPPDLHRQHVVQFICSSAGIIRQWFPRHSGVDCKHEADGTRVNTSKYEAMVVWELWIWPLGVWSDLMPQVKELQVSCSIVYKWWENSSLAVVAGHFHWCSVPEISCSDHIWFGWGPTLQGRIKSFLVKNFMFLVS